MYCHQRSWNNDEIAQLTDTLSGVPLAAGSLTAFQMVKSTCSNLRIHKRKSARLVRHCELLLDCISDQAPLLLETDANATFDEAEAVLTSVHHQVQKWERCKRTQRFYNRPQIGRDLDTCKADIDRVLERLFIVPATVLRLHERQLDMLPHHRTTMTEAWKKILISPGEIELAVRQHNCGGNDARELMRAGQERLMRFPEEVDMESSSITCDGRRISRSVQTSALTTFIASVRGQLETALLSLHLQADIPPTTPILNNQVKVFHSHGELQGGGHGFVVEGCWLGKKKVALKAISFLYVDDPKVKRLQMRLKDQILVWSRLKHENVLTTLGIVTNTILTYIVSPCQWCNVRDYRFGSDRDLNPWKLLSQAAKGLDYLHDNKIIHGHLKCSNMLISQGGIVSLSHFGLNEIFFDVIGASGTKMIAPAFDIRWKAPELAEELIAPTAPSDIFSFGMSILELLTMENPYSHRSRDTDVLLDLCHGRLPLRPEEPEAVRWMTDGLWDMLNVCWRRDPKERMVAKELSRLMERACEWSEI